MPERLHPSEHLFSSAVICTPIVLRLWSSSNGIDTCSTCLASLQQALSGYPQLLQQLLHSASPLMHSHSKHKLLVHPPAPHRQFQGPIRWG